MTNNWTNKELEAATTVYVEMHRKEAAGEFFIKTDYYGFLAEKYDRSPKAFEIAPLNLTLKKMQKKQGIVCVARIK
ncbi:MAG: hypothetical protein OCC45_08150 [Desulfotalea sp.]